MHPGVERGLGDGDVEVPGKAGDDSVDSAQGLEEPGLVVDIERPDLELDTLRREDGPRCGIESDDLEPGVGQQEGDQLADLAESEHRDLVDDARHETSSPAS